MTKKGVHLRFCQAVKFCDSQEEPAHCLAQGQRAELSAGAWWDFGSCGVCTLGLETSLFAKIGAGGGAYHVCVC